MLKKNYMELFKDSFNKQKLIYKRNVQIIRKEMSNLRSLVINRDFTISNLTQILADALLEISELRINAAQREELIEIVKPANDSNQESVNNIKSLKLQLRSLKSVCEMYQDDSIKALEKARKLEEERAEISKDCQTRLNEMKTILENKAEDYMNFMEIKEKE